MHNENQTAGAEQLAHDRLEGILKLVHSGSSPEDISFAFKIDIETIQQIIAKDPMHRTRVVQSIKERSAKYRCAKSNRLMISPVMDRDENFYEQSILDPSVSIDQFIPSKKLKAKIEDFSKESLKVLEGYLRQKHLQEDILELSVECLSVLAPEAGMESALRALSAVEGETVRKLIGKLRGLVPEEILLNLMNQTARKLPSHSLCLSALIILEMRVERAFEEAFRCFTELLSQAALGPEAIDLAEEVSERLSSTQLSQINAALEACSREGGDELDGLRLKEANALLREGQVEAAIRLVNTLRISPRLEKELVRFYDEAGLSSEKVPILEKRLSAKLEEISRDSPSVAETFSILHQLLKAELHSQKLDSADQCLISLKAEHETLDKLGQQTSQNHVALDARIQRLENQTKHKEADCQKTLSSLSADVATLTAELDMANQTACQTQRNQDALIQRSNQGTQKSLNRLREEIRALHEQAAISGEKAMQLQVEIEQTQGAVAASETIIDLLRQEVKDMDEAWSEFKRTHSSQEVLLQALHKKSEITETALKSRTDTAEALTEVLLKAWEEIKLSQKTQDDRIQRSEEATQESLVNIREELQVLYKLASRSGKDVKQIQSSIKQSQKAEAATHQALNGLRDKVEAVTGVHSQPKEEIPKLQHILRPPPTKAEETKQPQLTQTLPKPQHTLRQPPTATEQPPKPQLTKTWPSGNSYRGELLNDKPHGRGTMQYATGRTYVGDWVNGTRQGRGVQTKPDGARYEGEWRNDKASGQGTNRWASGEVYSGSWNDDKKHGHGVYTWSDGGRYEGEYENDKMRHGVFTWPDGRRYEGEWENNLRQGHGVEVEPDGGYYTGTWSENKKHGEFSYSKGGTSRKQKWIADVLSK